MMTTCDDDDKNDDDCDDDDDDDDDDMNMSTVSTCACERGDRDSFEGMVAI